MKLNFGQIGIILVTLLILITIFTYSYNDEIEKEYFQNYAILDEELNKLDYEYNSIL